VRRKSVIAGGAATLVILIGFGAAWVTREDRSARPTKTVTSVSDVVEPSLSVAESSSSVAVVPVPMASSVAPAMVAAQDESGLMQRLRSLKDSDPAAAVVLAREGNRRFPDGVDAPERSSILVHALAEQGRGSEARGEAEDMVNRYPDSSWIREVELFTGAHRHRNIRVNDAGLLEYY
jgi:hypothetical protein